MIGHALLVGAAGALVAVTVAETLTAVFRAVFRALTGRRAGAR